MPKSTTRTESASNRSPNPDQPDFESILNELESVVAALEQGDISLNQALDQFERGIKLTRACQKALTEAEQRVETLLKDDNLESSSHKEK